MFGKPLPDHRLATVPNFRAVSPKALAQLKGMDSAVDFNFDDRTITLEMFISISLADVESEMTTPV
ncbi:MAG TPA: hypothetical protein VMP01_02250 [Pirellulaceae bacterium]|nr:hypothetical protein [Pirellulaceae bacterium]